MSVALTTKEEVKAYAGIDDTDTDTFIDDVIERISDYVNNYINRDILTASHVEYYDSCEQGAIIIKHPPIQSVTSIYYDTERVYGADTLVASTDYCMDLDAGIIKLDWAREWYGKFGNAFKVTYVGGYDAVPPALEHAVILKVCAELKRDNSQTALVSNSMEWQKRAEDMDNEADKILKTFKLARIA